MVIRSQAFDPPEYVSWKPSPAVLSEWEQTLGASKPRQGVLSSLTPLDHLNLYAGMLRTRFMDTYLKRWVRQGVISKAWLGTGEEAVTVGNVYALRRGPGGDVVGPVIRNAGACREMGMPMASIFKAYLGTYDQVSKGRDFHTGDNELGVIPPISMLATLVPICAGVALAFKQRHEDRVALTWVGDGATRLGDFHEGLGMAAAVSAPLIVVVQNNQVALGTRLEVHSRAPLDKLHLAYGIKGYSCDGNNVLDAYAVSVQAVKDCRKGRGPVLIVASTFRMGGHATHDEAEARQVLPPALFQYWGDRDPIGLYETHLVRSGLALEEGLTGLGLGDGDGLPEARDERNSAVLERVAENAQAEVEDAARESLESRDHRMPDGSDIEADLFADPES